MLDSDNYFSDELVLDDQDLALLDKLESQFQADTTHDALPVAKRRKTDEGWKATGRDTVVLWDDFEDLPEVSVLQDGTYAFGSVSNSASIHTISSPQQPALRARPHVDALQLHLEKLRKANLQMQQELQAAVAAKLKKEGEVSTLRRNAEKTAQDHVAQLVKLRTAKEQADAKVSQVQKEMKEEIERLRTQFVFKQHEMETSSRRAAWSIRSNRVGREAVMMTPVQIPSQMQGWSQRGSQFAGPSKAPVETPRQPRFGSLLRETPVLARSPRRQGGNAHKHATLPGFENAFASSSPVRALFPTKKGKEKAIDFSSPVPRLVSQGQTNAVALLSPPSSPVREYGRPAEDIVMNDHDDDGDNLVAEHEDVQWDFLEPPLDDFESRSLHDEFTDMVLTHRMYPSTSITLQKLVMVSLPSTTPPDFREASASARILEALAGISRNFDRALEVIASSFIQMMMALNVGNALVTLAALFDLMLSLAHSFPTFSVALLSDRPEDDSQDRQSSKFVTALSAISRDHLKPSSGEKPVLPIDSTTSLAEKAIGVLESVCWNIPEVHQDCLAAIANAGELMSVLLHPSQPPWLLHRSCRLLAVLATYPRLFKYLSPHPEPLISGARNQDTDKLAYLEQLCTLLIDPGHQCQEADDMKTSILCFIGTSSISSSDAPAVLLQSQMLIPSLVKHLAHLASLFWEADDATTSPTTTISSARALSQTLCLLHHLIFDPQSPPEILQRSLYAASHRRRFNGITHMFLVTLGRLSYADTPEWIGGDARLELDLLTDMARQLLDQVVEGPECDSIWSVYQGGLDQEGAAENGDIGTRSTETV